jgi:hypothetical protein
MLSEKGYLIRSGRAAFASGSTFRPVCVPFDRRKQGTRGQRIRDRSSTAHLFEQKSERQVKGLDSTETSVFTGVMLHSGRRS